MTATLQDNTVKRVLSKRPWPSQLRFHRSDKRFKAFSGPVGSGKSLALVYEALKLSLMNPGMQGLIGAPTYRMLHDVTMRAFFDELDAAGIPRQYYKAENRVVLLDTGSQVLFRPLEQFDRLRGTNLAWFGLDEMTYSPEEAFLQLQSRLREPRAQRLCGFGVFTPKGFDWVYDRFVRANHPNYELIKAAPRENKSLPSDFYDTLSHSYDDRLYRQEVLGEFINVLGGRVYYSFDQGEHCRPVEPNKRLPICWSLDFNITPMCSVIAQIHDESTPTDLQYGKRNRRLEILDEIYLKDARTQDACEEFIRRLSEMGLHEPVTVQVYGDASGQNRDRVSAGARSDWEVVKQFLSNQNIVRIDPHYRNESQNPSVRDRVNSVNALLKNFSGEIRMTVHPRCKQLIRDLERVNWQEGTAQLEKADRSLTHMSDALGYLCEREFRRSETGYRSQRLI